MYMYAVIVNYIYILYISMVYVYAMCIFMCVYMVYRKYVHKKLFRCVCL